MSENGKPRDLGARLESWMRAAAPDRAPDRLLEEAFARTMAAHQLPVYPWHRIRSRRIPGSADRGTRVLAIVLVAMAIVVISAIGLLLGSGRSDVIRPSPSAHPVATPPGAPVVTVTPVAGIPVANPETIASDGKTLWVFTTTGLLARIDPATNRIAASVQLPRSSDAYQAMAGNSAGLWISDWDASLLLRRDPQTLKAITELTVGAQPKGVLVTGAGVFVATTHGGTVDRIDPTTNKVRGSIAVGPTGASGPNWLATGFNSLWVDIPNAGSVARIDPATGAVQATITVPAPADPCGGVGATSDAIWVASCDSTQLARIDPVTNTVSAIVDLGHFSHDVVVVGDRPWISIEAGQIVRIDPNTNLVDRAVAPGVSSNGGEAMTIADGSIWVVDASTNRILRLPLDAFG